ncbi:TonB-dependent receptor, partial [Pseudomonas aeruginosa]|uniref:TonB-dependent receptor domain-containing protein n=1 Tax=Pseudomonas aeruginosa TaxID=287 RepID=UPI0031B783C4
LILKTKYTKLNVNIKKYEVKKKSPSKATASSGWAPDPWSLRVQSTTSFDVSDAQGYKVDGYTTVDLLGSYQLPVGTLSFSIENLFDRDYTTVWGQRAPLYFSPG